MTAAPRGFADDFAAFRRLGGIGIGASLLLSDNKPELGGVVVVTVDCIEAATLIARTEAGERARWQVTAGSRIQLVADDALRLALYGAGPLALAEASIDPWFVAPSLRSWLLPNRVTWDAGSIDVIPECADTVSVTVEWREIRPNVSRWQAVIGGGKLAVPERSCRIALRATLASRHAALTRAAVCVVEHTLDVAAPQPLVIAFPAPPVCRFNDATVRWVVRWASSVAVSAKASLRPAVIGQSDRGQTICQQIPSDECGTVTVDLDVTGMDGGRYRYSIEQRIVPREIEIQAWAVGPGRVELRVSGGTATAVTVPQRGIRQKVNANSFGIAHAIGLPTLAFIEVRDDLGQISRHSFPLKPQPLSWSQSPPFSELRWQHPSKPQPTRR